MGKMIFTINSGILADEVGSEDIRFVETVKTGSTNGRCISVEVRRLLSSRHQKDWAIIKRGSED